MLYSSFNIPYMYVLSETLQKRLIIRCVNLLQMAIIVVFNINKHRISFCGPAYTMYVRANADEEDNTTCNLGFETTSGRASCFHILAFKIPTITQQPFEIVTRLYGKLSSLKDDLIQGHLKVICMFHNSKLHDKISF